ncbi:MAG: hypothetical protein JOY62_04090 [Acidobacteriaceae bacterium]|nr:hypothetical protein [Acidobacteriaceae bacterium]MBV9779133.1 hypothetical protein [Acidobacteriaceae bacterium]
MSGQYRLFEAGPDPFGRMWKVQFRWLQTGISIRHADTVDVKFFIEPQDGSTEEKVIALPHPMLLEISARQGWKLTDPMCIRIAALHVNHMIETSEDMDKTLVTLSAEELGAYAEQLNHVTVQQRR